MTLKMKTNCQICDQSLEQDSEAYICVYECTFCAPCTEERHNVCPNCGGELVRRPKRNNKSKAISLCFYCFLVYEIISTIFQYIDVSTKNIDLPTNNDIPACI